MATNDLGDTQRRYPVWRPDYLCKWCLTYVGQRRQFCSADCAAQFKICQKRREQRQDLNISVDYYGNVKLSIQGLPLGSQDDITVTQSYPSAGKGVPRPRRRRKRCKHCARLLRDGQEDYCDEQCSEMDQSTSKNKSEEFLNIFQQKEAAERRRIRKWLQDAQDQYTKTVGDDMPYNLALDEHRVDKTDLSDEGDIITSGPADLGPIPVRRSPINLEVGIRKGSRASHMKTGTASPFQRTSYVPKPFRIRRGRKYISTAIERPAIYDLNQSRLGKYIYKPPKLKYEVITGGPMTLNPIPLRRRARGPEQHRPMDHDRRHLMIDLKWIPKFDG